MNGSENILESSETFDLTDDFPSKDNLLLVIPPTLISSSSARGFEFFFFHLTAQ